MTDSRWLPRWDRANPPSAGGNEPNAANPAGCFRRSSCKDEPPMGNFGVECSTHFDALAKVVRVTHHNVEWQIGAAVSKWTQGLADGGSIGRGVAVNGFHHQQIHVAVRGRYAVGIGAEEYDLLGVELLNEHSQVGQQLVGDFMHRVARVAQHILADLRAEGRGAVHSAKITGLRGHVKWR